VDWTAVVSAAVTGTFVALAAWITRPRGQRQTRRQVSELHSGLGNGFAGEVLGVLVDLKAGQEQLRDELAAHRRDEHQIPEQRTPGHDAL